MYNLHGNTYPAYIWKDFMDDIHKNLDSTENFKNYDGGESSIPASTQKTEASTAKSSDTTAASTEATTTEAATTEASTTEAPTTATPPTEAPTDTPSDEDGE